MENPPKLFTNEAWQRCYEDYLQHIFQKSKKEESVEAARYVLEPFFKGFDTPAQITKSDVEHFIASGRRGKYRRGEPIKSRTRNWRLGVINGFYNYAQLYTITWNNREVSILRGKVNPCSGVVRATTTDERRAFEEDEIPRFFLAIPQKNWIGKRDFALFLTYFLTGRRRREIVNLLWGDIYPNGNLEGGGTGVIYKYKGKGHTGKDQTATLPRAAWEAIITYLRASERIESIKPQDAVFVSTMSQWQATAMGKENVNALFRKYAIRAGLRFGPGDVSDLVVHSWRYTAGLEWYEQNGHDIVAVAEKLGHSSINTTLLYLKRRRKAKPDPIADLVATKYGF